MTCKLCAALFGMVSIVGVCAIREVEAADLPAPASEESGWTFTVAPYMWLAGIDGDVASFGAPPVGIDASISDVLKNFDIGLMGAAEARNGRFSLASDLFWAKLSVDGDTPAGILADSVELTTQSLMFTGVGGYSVFYEESGNLDVIAGARLWVVDNTLDFSGGLLGGTSLDDSESWVDLVIGLKGRAELGSGVFLTGWGMIGGFGISSDFMWDVQGGIGYQFNEKFSTTLSFRAVGVDYENDSFVYDIVQAGPMFGAVFKF